MPADLSAALEHLGGVAPRSDRLWPALRSLGPAFATCGAALERLAPPGPVADLWRRDLIQTRARNLVLVAELEGALAALAAEGVETVIFKGAAALDRLYADPGTRPMDDADVLVRPGDRSRAAAALGRLGFGLRPAEPGRFGPVDEGLHGEWTFVKPVGPLEVEIDLHWHLVADARLRRLFPGAEDGEVWTRTLPARVGAAPTRRLGAADAALSTALAQVLGHPWSHPLGYLDLWLELGGMGGPEPVELCRLAREGGLRSSLWWSLRFAGRLFGPTGVGGCSPSVSGYGSGPVRIGRPPVSVGGYGFGPSWACPCGAPPGMKPAPSGHFQTSVGTPVDTVASVGLSRTHDSGTPPPAPAYSGRYLWPAPRAGPFSLWEKVRMRASRGWGGHPVPGEGAYRQPLDPLPTPVSPSPEGLNAPFGDGWAALAPPVLSRRLGELLVGGDWLGVAAFRREMAARDLFVLLLAGPGGVARGLAGPASAGALPDGRGTVRAALALVRAAGRALVG